MPDIPVMMRSEDDGSPVPLCTAQPHELDALVAAVNRWGFADRRGRLFGDASGQFAADHVSACFEIVGEQR